jgi:hypothetical protein
MLDAVRESKVAVMALRSVKEPTFAVILSTLMVSTLIFRENSAVPLSSVIISTEFWLGYRPTVSGSNVSVTGFSKVRPDILIDSNTSFRAVISDFYRRLKRLVENLSKG